MENDADLADRTTLTPVQIADLLNFVLRSTYFQYNGSIYEQRDGAAMGSPVSLVAIYISSDYIVRQTIIHFIIASTTMNDNNLFLDRGR